MKKNLLPLLILMVLFTSCGNKQLKEGIYEASNTTPESTVTAKVTIDDKGKITDVYFDETSKDTTKKSLGDNYGMKSEHGSKIGEWYEQAISLENAIIENQGVEFITLDKNGKTDAISGCTIKIDHLIKVFNDAIKKAK